VGGGVTPNRAIIGLPHPDLPDMLRGMAGRFQKPGQSGRQMVVNEESHAD
jgi:hypothetical protein